MFTKKYYSDTSMSLPDLEGSRSLYLTLYDAEHPDSFLACAKINEIKPKLGVAKFGHDGIRGHISIKQTSPFHPAVLDVELNGLHDVAGSFHIHQYPVPTRHNLEDVPCAQTGGHFNPFNVDKSLSPAAGEGSFDEYEVGDLSGKYGGLADREERSECFTDTNLSLFGEHSIVDRSVVIHKNPGGDRWVCANIELAEDEDEEGSGDKEGSGEIDSQ